VFLDGLHLSILRSNTILWYFESKLSCFEGFPVKDGAWLRWFVDVTGVGKVALQKQKKEKK